MAFSARRAIEVALVVAVVARSLVFVLWPQSYFDANQAVIGLMAKHVSEGRAWPLFMYGQSYVLAVEAWVVAPIFLISGVSVTALKSPLLVVNVAIALLLVRLLEREVGLSPALAGAATLVFAVPSPSTAAQLLEANGGNVETLLSVVLIWATRMHPLWCGVVLGLGGLQRTFTFYGLVSLLLTLAVSRELFTRDAVRRVLLTLTVVVGIWSLAMSVQPWASALGPGTTPADLHHTRSQLQEIEGHLCVNPRTVIPGLEQLVTSHWAMLFGTMPQSLLDYGIESRTREGLPGAGLWLGALMLVAAGRVMWWRVRGDWVTSMDACRYLVTAGLVSAVAYVIARCGVLTIYKMNYDLLSLLGGVGLAAWYLRLERIAWLRRVWVAGLLTFTALHATEHLRLLGEYITHPPRGGKQQLIAALDDRGIRYGFADYALSYPITFLTNERITIASTTRVRVGLYQREVIAHRHEAVAIKRHPCGDKGAPVMPRLYLCAPEP